MLMRRFPSAPWGALARAEKAARRLRLARGDRTHRDDEGKQRAGGCCVCVWGAPGLLRACGSCCMAAFRRCRRILRCAAAVAAPCRGAKARRGAARPLLGLMGGWRCACAARVSPRARLGAADRHTHSMCRCSGPLCVSFHHTPPAAPSTAPTSPRLRVAPGCRPCLALHEQPQQHAAGRASAKALEAARIAHSTGECQALRTAARLGQQQKTQAAPGALERKLALARRRLGRIGSPASRCGSVRGSSRVALQTPTQSVPRASRAPPPVGIAIDFDCGARARHVASASTPREGQLPEAMLHRGLPHEVREEASAARAQHLAERAVVAHSTLTGQGSGVTCRARHQLVP
jgi:hypothetical protein